LRLARGDGLADGRVEMVQAILPYGDELSVNEEDLAP
jgi:hypothetical protein